MRSGVRKFGEKVIFSILLPLLAKAFFYFHALLTVALGHPAFPLPPLLFSWKFTILNSHQSLFIFPVFLDIGISYILKNKCQLNIWNSPVCIDLMVAVPCILFRKLKAPDPPSPQTVVATLCVCDPELANKMLLSRASNPSLVMPKHEDCLDLPTAGDVIGRNSLINWGGGCRWRGGPFSSRGPVLQYWW